MSPYFLYHFPPNNIINIFCISDMHIGWRFMLIFQGLGIFQLGLQGKNILKLDKWFLLNYLKSFGCTDVCGLLLVLFKVDTERSEAK